MAEATRPDAPTLAAHGPHKVGVKTIQLSDTNRNRNLNIEVWYPAQLATNQTEQDTYKTSVGSTLVKIIGQAARNATPETAKFPLLIVSHGQPGNRFALSYLTEHLASQGFVVAAIDHTHSTYQDLQQETFVSSLVDRPLDILFAMNELPKQLTNADGQNVGLIGYSYGGYSVLNAAGIGLSKSNLQKYCTENNNEGPCFVLPYFDPLVAVRGTNISPDPRIKAVFTMAAYGAPWLAADDLTQFKTPLFIACGENDDIALYKRDSKKIFELSGAKPSYLLTLAAALHNPWVNPAPPETRNNAQDYERWSEPVWDKERSNDITKHFASAFFGTHLQHNPDATKFLEPSLPGFAARTEIGLKLETKR